MFSSVTGLAYLFVAGLSLAGLICISGTTREAWAFKETAIGISLLALAILVHGIFISGAATFGPTPVLQGEVFGLNCGIPIDYTDCNSVDLSTGYGYLLDARLPEPVKSDEFFRGDKHVTAQISIWNAQIHWMRTDNTNPPTKVGAPARISYFAIGEVLIGLSLVCLAFMVWREAERKGITRESDPFALLRRMPVPTHLC